MALKAPKKIKIGGHNVSIKYEDLDEDGSFGKFKLGTNEIILASGLHHDQERSTALHEVLHGIFAVYGLRPIIAKELEEKLVWGLESGLHQVLKDNPKFVAYFLEKENAS